MVHHAKVARWVTALFGGLAVVEVVLGVSILVSGLVMESMAPGEALGVGLLQTAVGVLFGLALWGCYRIRYEITGPNLVVRYSPFRTTVPLDAIVEVFPTRNPLSAPAPSLDRLQIKYRTKGGGMWFALISPKDREGFVRDLAAAAPQLRRVGDDPLRLKAE